MKILFLLIVLLTTSVISVRSEAIYADDPFKTISAVQTKGYSDAVVLFKIVDSTALTGDKYNVVIKTTDSDTLFSLIDVTMKDTLLKDTRCRLDLNHPSPIPVIHGFQVYVYNTGKDSLTYELTSRFKVKGVYEVKGPGGVVLANPVEVRQNYNSTGKWKVVEKGTYKRLNFQSLPVNEGLGYNDYEIRFSLIASRYYLAGYTSAVGDAFYTQPSDPLAQSTLPFRIYDIGRNRDRNSQEKQLAIKVLDNKGPLQKDSARAIKDGKWTQLPNGDWEEIFAYQTPYRFDSAYAGVIRLTDMKFGCLAFRGEIPEAGTVIKIVPFKPLADGDVFEAVMPGSYTPQYSYIDVNQIKMFVANNGEGSHNPFTQNNGFYWPKDTVNPKSAIYYDGFLWTGRINNELRANGNYYIQGLKPGIINFNGTQSNPADTLYKVWKIKRNWESLPQGSERIAYEYDYNNWPSEIGAPYVDVNKDGKFTRGVDRPKFTGDQVLFYAANDLDSNVTKKVFGSLPLGLEFQTTVFGFDKQNELKDVVFKSYKIINKSKNMITDMYLGYWADNDIGNGGDDFIGCDTLLNLGFSYKSTNNDYYYGAAPPAIGHMFLQTPAGLPMTSFCANFKNASGMPQDIVEGTYEGTIETYNLLRGLTNFGQDIINPYTNKPTIFPLSGDPEQGQGWYEGKGWPGGPYLGGDRRYIVNSGPFTMAPGDTQRVVIAIIAAKGTDNINSVTQLKNKARFVRSFFNNEFLTSSEDKRSTVPGEFKLEQNFPNPFNPATTISYSLPVKSYVELRIYDLLGREVSTLVNKEQNAGTYKIQFNASKLPSGIYIYNIHAGEFSDSKKFLLLK